MLNLTAVPAPDDTAAAQYYPAIYWYAMLKIAERQISPAPAQRQRHPRPRSRPGRVPRPRSRTDGCVGCHQLGNKATREIPSLGTFKTGDEAWARRIQSGQAGAD